MSAVRIVCTFTLVTLIGLAQGHAGETFRSADHVVLAALQAEADGTVDRRELLEAALKKSSGNALARWYLGYVRSGDRWVSIDQLVKNSNSSLQLGAYHVYRDRLMSDESLEPSQRHRRAAIWCGKNGLVAQQEAHLVRLLEFNPNDAEVRGQLGHVNVDGVWLDPQEIQLARHRANRAAQAMVKWRPLLADLGRRLAGGDGPPWKRELIRQKAIQQWDALDDPAAIPAMEVVFSTRWPTTPRVALREKSPPGSAERSPIPPVPPEMRYIPGPLMVIEKLSHMPAHEATLSLARHAVLAPSDWICREAIEKLKTRPLEHYVPAMLAALHTPMQSRAGLYWTPDGRLLHRQMFFRQGQQQDELAVLDTVFFYDVVRGGNRQVAMGRALARARRQQSVSRTMMARSSGADYLLNDRICKVLAEATGEDFESSPENWWQWWNDYNEVFVEGEKPVRRAYRQTGVMVDGVVRQPTPNPALTALRAQLQSSFGGLWKDCLGAGTPVWTDRGMRPIEQIQVGDLVLAQDPETGEAAFKPVLRTTTRSPGPTVRIVAGEQTIEASGGHRFWFSGEGWVRARDCSVERRLYGLEETQSVVSVTPGEVQETFNLIVADFHTYFIGDAMILSHDNTIVQPTNARVPGFTDK